MSGSQYHQQRAVELVDPEQVTVEVAISPVTGRILLRVMCATGTVEQEKFWAEGIQELVLDLGREDLLVVRPGDTTPQRRARVPGP